MGFRLIHILFIHLIQIVKGFPPLYGLSYRSQETSPVQRMVKAAMEIPEDDDDFFSSHLIDSLDLDQIIDEVAKHTTTNRGYESMLSLVQRKQTRNGSRSEFCDKKNRSGRRDRYKDYRPYIGRELIGESKVSFVSPIAKSLEEVHSEYVVVEEATLLLTSTSNAAKNGNEIPNLTYPPIYGEDSSPYDVCTIPQTDDDEWLYLSPEEYTVEHILQAEQVIKKLLQIRQWSQQEAIQNFTPKLAQIASNIDGDDVNILSLVYGEISGNVEIIRIKSSVDPILGKISYSIRIKDIAFPVLQILREKEERLIKKGGKELDKDVVAIRNEIDKKTIDIIYGLAQKITCASKSLDHALEIAARLDVVIAKAAYASSLNGVVPLVQTHGEILIENFLHPILLKSMGANEGGVVPVDLRLSSETGERALIISGPNGGGKTLSMKSFGLVSILTKLGIPIPIKKGGKRRPRVDYFDKIFVNVGDQQSVLDGESTWTSILNSCAKIMVQTIDDHTKERKNSSYIVLLDELGTGTDPESGGAVAQAILEELIANSCKVVVTTHLPRLKALSYNNKHIGCAAVLLDYSDPSTFRRPSFKLEYGLIGESHALNAASRCVPSLPDSVLSRASNLMDDAVKSEESGTNESYIQALTSSMEVQLQRSKDATSSVEEIAKESFECRRALVSLARSYECHLDRRLESLENSFQKLKADKGNNLELIGDTLSELKIVKKKIVSQRQLLADKGLKVLPTDYVLNPGESVVIISNDKWNGISANILVSDSSYGGSPLGQSEVLVSLDVDLIEIDPTADRSLILQRHEIAIWNLDSIYDDDIYQSKPATSISDSKRKINSLLSTLNSVSSKKDKKPEKKRGNSFQSSRQRKAANNAKKKKR